MGDKRVPALSACRAPGPSPGQTRLSAFTEAFSHRSHALDSNASAQDDLRERLSRPGRESSMLRARLYDACEMPIARSGFWQRNPEDAKLIGSPYDGQVPAAWECETLADHVREHKGLNVGSAFPDVQTGKETRLDSWEALLYNQGIDRGYDADRQRYARRAPWQWANEPDMDCAQAVADCVYEQSEGLSWSNEGLLACVEGVDKQDLGAADQLLRRQHPGEDLRERVFDDISPFAWSDRRRAAAAVGPSEDFYGLQVCASMGLGAAQGVRCWGLTSDLEPFGSVAGQAAYADASPEASVSLSAVHAGRDCFTGIGSEVSASAATPLLNVGAGASALLDGDNNYCGTTVGVSLGLGDATPLDGNLSRGETYWGFRPPQP